MVDYNSLLVLDGTELIEQLENFYIIPSKMPSNIETIEDMNEAAKLLLWLSGNISFLNSFVAYANIKKRKAKMDMPKADYEDYVGKEFIITKALEVAKAQYQAISRAVTIRIEINKEMNLR